MRKHIILSTLAVGIMAVSCTKSALSPSGPTPGGENPDLVSVGLGSLSAPAPLNAYGESVGTKSTPDMAAGSEDGQIKDLWAIQYDENGNLFGTPYYTSDIPVGKKGVPGFDYSYDQLSLRLTSSAGKSHTVYFIGNTHNGTLFTADNAVPNLAALRNVVMGYGKEYQPTSMSSIPMFGTYKGTVASGTPVTGVKMERLAAKLSVRYKSSISGFTLTGIRVCNVPSGFRFAEKPTGSVNYPAPAEGSHLDYPVEDPNVPAVIADGYRKLIWYMPESLSQATSGVTAIGDRTLDKSDGKPAYIELTGILREGDRCRKATLKVLLGDLGTNGTAYSDFNVKRNHIYGVTIDLKGFNPGDNRVTVESFDMSNSAMVLPAETEGTPRDSVVFDIRKCLANGFTTQSQLNGMLGEGSALTADVLWQDGNVINTANVTLDKVNGLLTVRSSKKAMGNAVVALYPDASKAQGTILWSWHVWVTDYKPNRLPDGTTELGYAAREMNTAIAVTGGQVHTYGTEFRKANGPSKTIMDRNLGATTGLYGPPEATVSTNFGMQYQWGRKDPMPHWGGDDLTPALQTIYGPDGKSTLTEGAKDDVAAAGLKKVSVTTAGGAGPNLPYAVKNPLSFIYNPAGPFDWYTNVDDNAYQNNSLWGDGIGKSAYDPCPRGWRIPAAGTWSDFGENPFAEPFWYYINGEKQTANGTPKFERSGRNGRLYEAGNVKAWYTVAGYRHPGSAEAKGFGSDEGCWSSGVDDTGSLLMSFYQMSLGSNYRNYRSLGFSVRCIQE